MTRLLAAIIIAAALVSTGHLGLGILGVLVIAGAAPEWREE